VAVTDGGGLTGAAAITVNVSRVYLSPGFVSVTLPDTVVQGQAISARVRATNQGNARATAKATLRFYARPNGGGDDILLKTRANLTTDIAPGGGKTYTTSITLPDNATLPAGDYTLYVEVQYGESTTSAADDTAVGVAEAVVTITPEVISTGLPAAVLPGATAMTRVRLTNDGNVQATSAVTLRVYLSQDGTLDGADAPIGGPIAVPSLMAPDGTRVVDIPVTIPEIADLSDGEGDYQVLVTSVYDGDPAVEALGADPVTVSDPFIDLAATIKSSTLPTDTVVPGDVGRVVATVANLGNAAAAGDIIVTLYASQTGEVDGTAIQLADPIAATVNLAAGVGSRDFTFNAAIPTDMSPEADYQLVVEVQVDPAGDLTEDAGDLANNIAASGAGNAATYALQFGDVGARNNVVLAVTDPATDEVVRFSLPGAGTGEVTYNAGDGTFDMTVTGTNSASHVVVTTPLGVEVDLGDISVPTDGGGADVNLGSFTAIGGNLLGDADFSGGLRRFVVNDVDGGDQQAISVGAAATPIGRDRLVLILGDVTDLSIDSLTPIQKAAVESWTDVITGGGDDDVITASWLAKLVSDGGFQADLDLDPAMAGLPANSPAARGGLILGRATIDGMLEEAVWAIEGKAGTLVLGAVDGLTLRADRAGRIIVNGDMANATVTLDTALIRRGNALGTLRVLGALDTSVIRTVGNVGRAVLGQMVDSILFAGVNPAVTTLPDNGDFTAADVNGLQAAIRRFTIKSPVVSARKGFQAQGDLFTNSLVAAGRLGRAIVRNVTTDNADIEFGFAADSTINLLTWFGSDGTKVGTFKKTAWLNGTPVGSDDFIVRVV